MLGKITASYKKLQAPVKASLWFLICGFLQKGISMLTTPVFTRIMTEAEYGRYSVYNSWLGLIQIIVSLNLAHDVYTRGLVKNEEDQDRFSSSMLGLSTTCILIWSALYFIFHKAVNSLLEMSTLLMAAMLLEIWAHSVYQFWANRERVHYRYKKLVIVTLAYVILRPLLGVVCVMQVETWQQTEARAIISTLVQLLLFTGLYISLHKKGRQFFSKKYWGYALRFNLPLIPHYLSQTLLNQSDRLMIDRICGPADAAYYSVAYTIAMVLLIVNTSVSATMNPWVYKSLRAGEYKKIGKVSYCVMALVAGLNLTVVLCAPEILHIMAPDSYQAALWAIPPVAVSVYFSFLYNLFATFEFYYAKTQYVTLASIAAAALNLGLNAIFIPKFGFLAAGYTTLVCFILCTLAHYCFMRHVTGQYIPGVKLYRLRIIWGLGLGLMAGAAVIMLLYETVVIRYSLLLLLGLLVLWKRKWLMDLLAIFKK